MNTDTVVNQTKSSDSFYLTMEYQKQDLRFWSESSINIRNFCTQSCQTKPIINELIECYNKSCGTRPQRQDDVKCNLVKVTHGSRMKTSHLCTPRFMKHE